MRDYNNKNTYALGAGIYTYPPSQKSKSFAHAPPMAKNHHQASSTIKHKNNHHHKKRTQNKKARYC
jgi:hypothetical protein